MNKYEHLAKADAALEPRALEELNAQRKKRDDEKEAAMTAFLASQKPPQSEEVL